MDGGYPEIEITCVVCCTSLYQLPWTGHTVRGDTASQPAEVPSPLRIVEAEAASPLIVKASSRMSCVYQTALYPVLHWGVQPKELVAPMQGTGGYL